VEIDTLDGLIVASASPRMANLEGALSGYVIHLNFGGQWAPVISLKWLKLQLSNFVHRQTVKSQHKSDKSLLKVA